MRSKREAAENQGFIVFVIVLSAFFILVCTMVFGTIRTSAASADVPYKYYTSIRIQAGDTLWDIADTYCSPEYDTVSDYIEEICSINRLSSGDEIHSGQYIMVPYYSQEYLK